MDTVNCPICCEAYDNKSRIPAMGHCKCNETICISCIKTIQEICPYCRQRSFHNPKLNKAIVDVVENYTLIKKNQPNQKQYSMDGTISDQIPLITDIKALPTSNPKNDSRKETVIDVPLLVPSEIQTTNARGRSETCTICIVKLGAVAFAILIILLIGAIQKWKFHKKHSQP